MTEQFMTELYAVGFIDTTKSPPVVTGVGIYGTDAGSTCTDPRIAYPFDISMALGTDWKAAESALLDNLERFYPWAHALLGLEHRKAVQ